MKDLILHPQTKKALEQVLSKKPHAIMLTGNEGSGKYFTARKLAEMLLDESIDNYAYFIHIYPEGKHFTIEQIRELQKLMKLKTTGTKPVRRVALLQDVHTMTIEAQNALLKLLEEPPEDTVLLLTAQGDTSLKPTIYSRVQRVHIKPVLLSDLPTEHTNNAEIQKLYSLSAGDVGLLLALLQDKSEHALVKAINQAKQLITEPAFKRLVKVDSLSKDKAQLADILVALKRISSAALKSATLKSDHKNKKRWETMLEHIYTCESMLNTNVNSKLLLTELFLNI